MNPAGIMHQRLRHAGLPLPHGNPASTHLQLRHVNKLERAHVALVPEAVVRDGEQRQVTHLGGPGAGGWGARAEYYQQCGGTPYAPE